MTTNENIFLQYLTKNRLAVTDQRRIVLQTFLDAEGHHSSEELHRLVSLRDQRISQATVYRTLRIFTECGIAEALDFGDGITRFECVQGESHHDHLVCRGCGKKIEVVDERIEQLQDTIAQKKGFKLKRHKMVLYGYCASCNTRKPEK